MGRLPSLSSTYSILEAFEGHVNRLIDASLSSNTKIAYDKAINVFHDFRLQYCLPPLWPPPVDHIVNFLAFLASKDLAYSTAKVYLSALSHNLQMLGLDNPLKTFIVQKMLAGLRKTKPVKDIRSPITYQLLLKILQVLPTVTKSRYEHLLFGSAFSVAFFGLLRISELTSASNNNNKNVIHLSDLQLTKDTIILNLRFSKTDQCGNGFIININKSSESLVCFEILETFLQCRSKDDGPLFCHLSGSPLSSYQFSSILHKTLTFLGIETKTFKTHSFRIGAATHMYVLGIAEQEIQRRGRWSSDAYKHYLRPELVTY